MACCLAVIFYSTIEAERYSRDEDTSKISFKSFNHDLQDTYPDVTFCLEGGHFSQSVDEFRLSETSFINVLKGYDYSSNTWPDNLNQRIRMKADMYFSDLKEMIHSYYIKTNGGMISYSNENRTSDGQLQEINSYFHTTHIDPEKLCFTRNSETEKGTGILRKEDEIVLNLKNAVTKTNLKIYFHYPGQFLRNIEIPVAESYLYGNDTSQKITLTIPDIAILRKRSKSSDPCKDTDEDDANNLRMKAMKDVKCQPAYWKSLMRKNTTFPVCKTLDEHRKISRQMMEISSFLSKSTTPCSEMRIPSAVQKDKIIGFRQLQVSILYLTTQYQEIINIPDFDFDSMFSAIGGFVGIFLGYSLLQASDLVMTGSFKRWGKPASAACVSDLRRVKGNIIILA